MPLVKVKEKFQVTIPAGIRRQLALKVGDVLEAEVEEDKIVLKPKAVIDRSKAIERLFTLLEKNWERNKDIPEEEVVQDVLEAIQEVRQERRKSGQKQR